LIVLQIKIFTLYLVLMTPYVCVQNSLGNPTGDSISFNSQSTYILPYQHPNGKLLLIYMADRWNFPNVDEATYVWLPMIMNSPLNFTISWYDKWTIKDF